MRAWLLVLCLLPLVVQGRVVGVTGLTKPKGKGARENHENRVVAVSAAATQPPKDAKGGKGVVTKAGIELPQFAKLLIGVTGIYAAFLYYGVYQESVFEFKAPDGSKFKSVWLLNAIEAAANVIVGGAGLQLTGGVTKGLPLDVFAWGGVSQVFAKAFTLSALAQGVSFPVVTLAKSGKMVPVMIGSILLGGAKYTLREYASVAAIIAGTTLVSLGKKSSGSSSVLGLTFIALSLTMDGITGGLQRQMKVKAKQLGLSIKPYDFMLWINAFMFLTAAALSIVFGDFGKGVAFCSANPSILSQMFKFAACSALGQSFIFYTIANFDPLVCTTVTTTRKVFSVLLSIFLNGHKLSTQGWAGIGIASAGIFSEILDKSGSHSAPKVGKDGKPLKAAVGTSNKKK